MEEKQGFCLEGIVEKAETHGKIQRFRLKDIPLTKLEFSEGAEPWLLVQGTRMVNNGEYVAVQTDSDIPFEDYGKKSKSGYYFNVKEMKIFREKGGLLLNTYSTKYLFDGETVGDLFGSDGE